MTGKLILFFVLLTNAVVAQQTFLVYRIKGNVKLKTGKQTDAITIGQLLKSNHTIWIDKGASVILICEGYNSFTIGKAGNHSMAAYLDSCKNIASSVSAKYFKFIWEELTHPHTTPENNRRKYMQNTGAVVRGCPGITIESVYDTVNNHKGDMRIKWKTAIPNDQLSFVVYDTEKEGRLLFTTPVSNNYMHLDTIKKYAGSNEEVYWNITINGNEMCSRKMIRFWDTADYIAFNGDLKNELQTILNEAERLYATGFLLEANHFLAEAWIYYKKAALLAPKELRYQLPLNDF